TADSRPGIGIRPFACRLASKQAYEVNQWGWRRTGSLLVIWANADHVPHDIAIEEDTVEMVQSNLFLASAAHTSVTDSTPPGFDRVLNPQWLTGSLQKANERAGGFSLIGPARRVDRGARLLARDPLVDRHHKRHPTVFGSVATMFLRHREFANSLARKTLN